MFEVKRGGKVRAFIFSDFLGHAAAWFGHAAACHENTGFKKAQHATTQGNHAAVSCSRVFVWGLDMPRHKENVLRYDPCFLPLSLFLLFPSPN